MTVPAESISVQEEGLPASRRAEFADLPEDPSRFESRAARRARFGARAFRLSFVMPAMLIAVYVTLLSDAIVTWQTAAVYWTLTLLVVWLIGRLAAMIEKSERDAAQGGALAMTPARGRRREERVRAELGAHERLTHLERVIVRQHRFVSDAAHELRTPLTAQALVGENVLACHGIAETELREAIVSMLEESNHMKRLIEGLLDLTRASLTSVVEHGVSRHPTALDLNALTRECVESLRVLAEEKQQRIVVQADGALWTDADLTMVRQALLNVIHNSIEHCPAGTQIEVSTAHGSLEEGVVRVQDDGPGIPLQDQVCVFERFYRGAGASRTRSLGLGLSIAKAILSSQGGGIELRSSPGAGCCFIMRLPLASAGRAHPPADQQALQ